MLDFQNKKKKSYNYEYKVEIYFHAKISSHNTLKVLLDIFVQV